jgi:glycosyltransferase involved in cell wall biosynthesis
MISVVIAAHDEEDVLGACLDALVAQADPNAVHLVVSANGCTDGTAEVARRRGATVVESAVAGKAAALNAADDVAVGFPRVYLDADIIVPPGGVDRVIDRLGDGVLAAVPRRILDTDGSPLLVKAYCTINERLPVFRHSLFGRGMIAVSAEGRARFDRFPDVIADDLFLDAQFAESEKRESSDVSVVVRAPRTTTALLHRLVRVRRGNAELRAAAARGTVGPVRAADRWAWLRDVVRPRPWLVFAAVPYVAITLAAAGAARRVQNESWGRDDTTRANRGSTDSPTRTAPCRHRARDRAHPPEESTLEGPTPTPQDPIF